MLLLISISLNRSDLNNFITGYLWEFSCYCYVQQLYPQLYQEVETFPGIWKSIGYFLIECLNSRPFYFTDTFVSFDMLIIVITLKLRHYLKYVSVNHNLFKCPYDLFKNLFTVMCLKKSFNTGFLLLLVNILTALSFNSTSLFVSGSIGSAKQSQMQL